MGKTIAKLAACLIIFALLAWGRAAGSPEIAPAMELNLFAASSLTPAFEELANDYENYHGEERIRINSGGSQLLRSQIEQGLPADIIAFAGKKDINVLIDRGLVANKQIFAENQLVLVVAPSVSKEIKGLRDLTKHNRMILASPQVPLGEVSREILTNAEKIYGEDFTTKVMVNVVSEEDSASQVISKLALGEADAALVYLSDVQSRPELQLNIIRVPNELYQPVEYYIAILKNSHSPNEDKAFMDFVVSAAGKNILTRHFLIPVERSPVNEN